MNSVTRKWRQIKFGRKFAKFGKNVRFFGPNVEIDGHVECGDRCRFRDNVIFRTQREGKIVFDTYCGCGNFVIIEATSLIKIGTMTWISEFSVIRDTTHLIYGTTEHWRYTPQIAQPVVIGNNCWIGSRAYIGPGVTIGDGAVVGSGSVVTKSIGEYEVWAGVPARKLAHRTDEVPPEKQKEFEELVAKYGIKENRYKDVEAALDV